MNTSVRDVLNQRQKSKFFTRRCCVSEKRSKVFTLFLLAGGMGVYAYLQINVMIQAYSNPVREINNVIQPTLQLPGIYICMPFVNLPDGSWWVTQAAVKAFASQLTMFADPRTSMAPLIALNNPSNPNVYTLTDCCKTTFLDFFVDCFTFGRTCPVPVRFLRGTSQTTSFFGSWLIKLQCLQVSPGIMFYANSDNLFIPFFLTSDNSVLALKNDWTISNRTDAQYDEAYLFFCNNYMYWPHKFVMFSYMGIENSTNVADILYQKSGLDAVIGGSQNRIRTDIGAGITSCFLQHFAYWDINGNKIIANTGWTTSYDLAVGSLPWVSGPSTFPVYGRVQQQNMAWMRLHVTMAEVQTREAILFTYLDLATTILSIIGSAAALTHIIAGPGDYDPKGLINKLFYNDVPVLKNAATDIAAAALAASNEQDKKKKKKEKKKAAEAAAVAAATAEQEQEH